MSSPYPAYVRSRTGPPEPHLVRQPDLAARLGQKEPDDVGVALPAGHHQGRRPLLVLQVDVGLAGEEGSHHVVPLVADPQYQGGLASLQPHKGKLNTPYPPATYTPPHSDHYI